MQIGKTLKLFSIFSIIVLLTSTANSKMSNNNKAKAWDCVGIYMANYFLPSGE